MPQQLRIFTILFLSCFCLCLQSGCLYLPQRHRNVELTGKRIEPAQLIAVVPGQTTKAEFIEKVGRPYLMMDDRGGMAYYWKMLAAYVPWLLPGFPVMAGGMVELSEIDMLLVSYDANGDHHQKDETIRPQPVKTINERAIEWLDQGACLAVTPVSPPAGQSVLYVFKPGCGWRGRLDA